MFYSIRGHVTHASPGTLRLQTGDIEWDLEASDFTLRSLASNEGPVRVFTFLYHREDALSLFAFATEEERTLFLNLIRVSGVGPRQAVRILSGASPTDIASAIAASDVDGLSRIPGIGKKTAAKIVLALQGRLQVSREDTGDRDVSTEIVGGLVEMGFDRSRALEAVRSAAASVEGLDGKEFEKEVFRKAIVTLSQNG